MFALATAPVADLGDGALETEVVGLGTAEAAPILPVPTWPDAAETARPVASSRSSASRSGRESRRPRWGDRAQIPVPSATQESPR